MGKKNKTITLKWNVSDVLDGSVFLLYHNNTTSDNRIGLTYVTSVTDTRAFKESYKINNPFKGRSSGKISITNGDGILEITFSNLQYDDAGVIIVNRHYGLQITQENVTLIVHGKC